MRIIAGKYKGSVLITPQGLDTRPTLDRAKETLFNIINFDISGAHCLDLFAGSGQIGLEFLSRGAIDCVFVDSSSKALDCVRKNIEKLKTDSQAKVINCDALRALDLLMNNKFDIIYIDPPYQSQLYISVLEKIIKNNLLSDDGYIICEIDNIDNLPEEINALTITKVKRVGSVNFVWYTKGEK